MTHHCDLVAPPEASIQNALADLATETVARLRADKREVITSLLDLGWRDRDLPLDDGSAYGDTAYLAMWDAALDALYEHGLVLTLPFPAGDSCRYLDEFGRDQWYSFHSETEHQDIAWALVSAGFRPAFISNHPTLF